MKKWVEKWYIDKKGASQSVDVKMYDDYREMLMNPEIDAVIISTPDHWHAQVAIEAALKGKHIYLQKPAALSIAEGRSMSDAVHKSGVVFQIGSQQRSGAQFRMACEEGQEARLLKLAESFEARIGSQQCANTGSRGRQKGILRRIGRTYKSSSRLVRN